MNNYVFARELNRILRNTNEVALSRILEKIAAHIYSLQNGVVVYDKAAKILPNLKSSIFNLCWQLEKKPSFVEFIKQMINNINTDKIAGLIDLCNNEDDASQVFLENVAIYFNEPKLVSQKGHNPQEMEVKLIDFNNRNEHLIAKFVIECCNMFNINKLEFIKNLPEDFKNNIMQSLGIVASLLDTRCAEVHVEETVSCSQQKATSAQLLTPQFSSSVTPAPQEALQEQQEGHFEVLSKMMPKH